MPRSAPSAPNQVTTVAGLKTAVERLRESRNTLGLVPTMGALHEGHLSLVRESCRRCDGTIVSIFVNPAQFAPGEDLDNYPRPLARDVQLLADEGVDLIFLPDTDEVYPPGCTTTVDPPVIARALEGESRPAHFRGVATVVLKLFQMSGADVAFFGQKDYQQSLVIQHMVRDLNVPIDIVVCPVVRDDDGLALSSRNRYLDDDQRKSALSLHRALQQAAESIDLGERDGRVIMAEMTQSLIEGGIGEIDYAVLADAGTLEVLDVVRRPAVLLVAGRAGSTRLIDNLIIN